MRREKRVKTTGSERSEHRYPDLKLLLLPAPGLTLLKYNVDITSTLKDMGPSVIHLFNINRIINIGLENIEFLFCGNCFQCY